VSLLREDRHRATLLRQAPRAARPTTSTTT
jgi:hypothetical protein